MQALCKALQRPELASQGLSARPEIQASLKNELRAEFEKRSAQELTTCFAALDACVEPVLSVAEAALHPQLQARQVVTQVPRGDGTSQAQIACPLKFSAGLAAPRHMGVRLGADSQRVLEGLGYSEEQIAEMRQSGAVL